MKKIVNKKIYDTNDAEKIKNYTESQYGNFNYLSETLYKTKNNRYFLFIEGGALSIHSKSAGNNSWGISDIIPLSKSNAKYWLENHEDRELISMFFYDDYDNEEWMQLIYEARRNRHFLLKRHKKKDAIKLAESTNGCQYGDHGYALEELYLNSENNFLLFASGGPTSIYSAKRGSTLYGIEVVTPISKEMAYEWLEKNDEFDLIVKYFSEELVYA